MWACFCVCIPLLQMEVRRDTLETEFESVGT